jgi:predicted Zn finger-like uncharacterized protein
LAPPLVAMTGNAEWKPLSNPARSFQYNPGCFIIGPMRIACPTCTAEYDVPEFRLTPGKTVRCARCGGKWVAIRDPEDSPDADETLEQHGPDRPEDAERPLSPVTAMDLLAAATPRPRPPVSLTAAWIMTLVILLSAVAAVTAWREPIVRAWPPSGRILASSDHRAPLPAQGSDSAAAPSSRREKK